MKTDWGQIVLTIGVAAATSLAAVGMTVGLRPSNSDVRTYLMAHPEVIPEAMAALEARDTGKAVASNRGQIEKVIGDAWLGNPEGDVTVVQFFDYNCGYCRASLPIIEQLVKADPNVKVVFRELPILSRTSYDAAKLSYAAARQGKFRAFHDPLYKAGQVSAATLTNTARAAGIDMTAAKAVDAAADAEIRANIKVAQALGAAGTPSWVIGDRSFAGMRPLSELQEAVKAARERR
jgi:protein-disulfide isomerase